LQTVIDSLTYPFYVINAHDRRVEMTNTAAHSGNLPGDSTCHAFLHQEDQPCEEAGYPCPLQEVKRTKQPVVVEHVHIDEEGNRRDVEIHGFPILDREGNVVQMIEYALDISERKQAQERVHQAEVRLAALEERERIGRELHDDLGQVIGYLNVQAQAAQARLEQNQVAQAQVILAQLAQAAQEAQSDVRQYILGIRTERMVGIRAERATGDQRPAGLAGGSFVAALSQYLRVLRLRYGLETRISLPDDPLDGALSPQVETQLLRIIREALTNAAKHAGVDRAWVVLTLHADEVQVVVEDDGRGFDLDPATAASESPTTEHFGLDIMRERAGAVGGSAEVHSAPGKGTRILVRLPRALAPSAEDVLGRGVRVLLVDDHPLYLEGLRTLLVSRGLHVVGQAHDGLEAIEQARELRPDLILMDVQMPGCDGLEATRRIKAELPGIKIVMLTMAAEGDLLFEALKSGAAGYLLKSLDSTQFFSLLAEVMAGQTALSPSLANQVLTEFARRDIAPPSEDAADTRLTPRQQEVLELVARDMSNQEIAHTLYISENTVNYHVGQILERLQMKNRRALTHYAWQQGLVPPAGGEMGSRSSETS
jgi:DNA-binding NarL/FixJ family response regulator/signal transduction histidine kinase